MEEQLAAAKSLDEKELVGDGTYEEAQLCVLRREYEAVSLSPSTVAWLYERDSLNIQLGRSHGALILSQDR